MVMLNYDISEKDEFLVLIRNMEKMMRVNPSMLLNSPDYAEKVQRFNSLVQLIPSFKLSKEESEEVQQLWESLKSHISKRAKIVEERAKLTSQELLLQTLKDIIQKWGVSSRDEKKEMINDVNRLQLDQVVIAKMTPEQVQEYNKLMNTIRGLFNVEQISIEEYSEFENSERRNFGL